jgi:ABC-type lipoprotein export system ATPase subunit
MSLSLNVGDLVVRSDRGRMLLKVGSLAVPAGSLVGVRGPSGAGKSTLLYALAGLLDNAEGIVRWGDTDLRGLSPEGRASFRSRNMGMVFQDFLLFEELGAAGNAGIAAMFLKRGDRAPLRERAAENLNALGLDPAATRLVSSYSGGERQRIAVARALANDAAIILADEPTASLHREAADRLIDDLCRIVRETGKTLVTVSHDHVLIDRMDRVLTIEDGAVTEDSERAAA